MGPTATQSSVSAPTTHTRAHQSGVPAPSSSNRSTYTNGQPNASELSSNQNLYSEVVNILASSANGCIREIGYYRLVEEHENLKKTYVLLKNHSATLDERISALEGEVNRLTKENAVLRQTQSLHADESYRLLNKKYHYVLNLLKEHHVVQYDKIEEDSDAPASPKQSTNLIDAASHVINKSTTEGQPVIISEPPLVTECHDSTRTEAITPSSTQLDQIDFSRDRTPTSAHPSMPSTHPANAECYAQMDDTDDVRVQTSPTKVEEIMLRDESTTESNIEDCEGVSINSPSLSGSLLLTTKRHVQELGDSQHSLSDLSNGSQSDARPQGEQNGHDQDVVDIKVELNGNDEAGQVNPTTLVSPIRSIGPNLLSPVSSCPPVSVSECDTAESSLEFGRSRLTVGSKVNTSEMCHAVDSSISDPAKSTEGASSSITTLQYTVCDTNVDMDVEDGDEGEEENWADLTDDETGKRPVEDCIGSIFFDDGNDERHCQLCDLRIQESGMNITCPDFSESTMRELITHLKTDHPIAWKKLRGLSVPCYS